MKDYSLRNDNIKLINALATSIGEHMTELFENGYDQGYVDGQKEKLANAMIHDHEVAEKTAYEQGLNDAWECARKISMPENEGGMSVKALQSIFGKAREIFNCTASEAIAKIKEYEDKQKQDAEIKVGYEVYNIDRENKRIVTAIDGNKAIQLCSNGKYTVDNIDTLHWTGREDLRIKKVLEKITLDKMGEVDG